MRFSEAGFGEKKNGHALCAIFKYRAAHRAYKALVAVNMTNVCTPPHLRKCEID